jgi:hypothetical protein
MEWIGSGYYEDEYRQMSDAGKLASRRLTRLGSEVAQKSFMFTSERERTARRL